MIIVIIIIISICFIIINIIYMIIATVVELIVVLLCFRMFVMSCWVILGRLEYLGKMLRVSWGGLGAFSACFALRYLSFICHPILSGDGEGLLGVVLVPTGAAPRYDNEEK